jgi:pantothenate kinase
MRIGLDIGGTLTKMACDSDEAEGGLELGVPADDRSGPIVTEGHVDDVLQHLNKVNQDERFEDIEAIGVTGVGADLCVAVARRYPDLRVAAPDGDAVMRELRTQVAGLRSLAARQGAPLPDAFLLASVGTGTSYTFVDGDVIRPFPIGNPMGGGTLLRYGGMLHTLENDDPSSFDQHSDIQMGDALPHLRGTLFEHFVMSSGGKIEGNDDASISKIVMTAVARDILLFGNMPDWQVKGPVVPIGSPIDAFPVFRHWAEKTFGLLGQLGIQHRFVKDASYAGAVGAYEFAKNNM